MARVTVEDCVEKVTNRFDLVLLGAHRARSISAGGDILVERDNDKNPVVALREIADGKVEPEALEESLISGLQRVILQEEAEEEAARPALPDRREGLSDSEHEMLKALQSDRDGAGPGDRGL